MNKVWELTVRNIKRYYRDKGAFFFSFLSVFIVVGLYIFFLADMQVQNIQAITGSGKASEYVIYTWIIGGLLCIPSVSVPIIIFTFKIEDAAEGIQKDLLVTPAKRYQLLLGYVTAACITGIAMALVTLVFGEAYICLNGGELLSIGDACGILGIIAVMTLSFSGFSFFITIRMKSHSAMTMVNTLLNTLIGFFAGLYFPIGYLSEEIALVIKIFPLSHASSLLRQILTKASLERILRDASEDTVHTIRQTYGIDLIVGKHELSSYEMLFSLFAFGLIFYIGSVMLLKRYKSN